MKRLAIMGGLLLGAGCGRCAAPIEQPQATVVSEPSEPVGEAPKAELVYRRAVERARQEINADNATERLRHIEREVDRELAEGP